jgi:hypothetical protein
MRLGLRAAMVLTAVVVAPVLTADRASANERLIRALTNDRSFKVRMQALRVLGKKLEKDRGSTSRVAEVAIERAVTSDDSHMVRGLACFILGRLADTESAPALTRALGDSNAFVRVQAQAALDQIRSKPSPGPVGTPPPRPQSAVGRSASSRNARRRQGSRAASGSARGSRDSSKPQRARSMVVSVEPMPGVSVPEGTMQRLRSGLRATVERKMSREFSMSNGDGEGFKLAGSIAHHSIVRTDEGTKITVVVRILVATLPRNTLKHVVSARASAETRSTYDAAVGRLEGKVLKAAVKKAVQDAMAEISRG